MCSDVFGICPAVSEICTCRLCCRARNLHHADFKSAHAGLQPECAGIRSTRRIIVLSRTHPQGRPFRAPSCLHFSAEGCARGGGVADHMLPDSPTCEEPDGQAFTTLQMLRLGVDIGICYIDGWPDHVVSVAGCLSWPHNNFPITKISARDYFNPRVYKVLNNSYREYPIGNNQ